MKSKKPILQWGLSLCLFAGMLAGCGDGSDIAPTASSGGGGGGGGGSSFTTITDLDASAGGLGASPTDPKNKYTYFDLSTSQVVDLLDAEADASTAWDIAFKRSSIKLNSGFSGPKGVVGFFTGNNAEAYDASGKPILAWFKSATAVSELPDFTAVTAAVTAAVIPPDSDFTADSLVPAIKGDGTNEGWWFYHGPPTHAVTAVATNWWVVKSEAGNSYAKFHVTDILRDSPVGFRTIRLEWQYQGPPPDPGFGPLLAPYDIVIPLAGGAQYLDFDTRTDNADPSTVPGWDMKIEYDGAAREYRITLNGGVSGSGQAGAFGPFDPATQDYLAGAEIPHYFKDSTGGIFVDSSWRAYNLEGNHKLWPNYRVYLIKSGTVVYKLQVLSYYHSGTLESSFYTFRFEPIAP